MVPPMDFFQEAGRRFEEAKQSVLSETGTDYRCEACEEDLTESYDTCPYCGADAVVAVED